MPDTVVLLIDDGSDDPVAAGLPRNYRHPRAPVIHAVRIGFTADAPRPLTVRQNLLYGWSYLVSRFAPRYLSNLDADMVVQPNWMNRLLAAHTEISREGDPFLLSAFHTASHRASKPSPGYFQKRSLGGAQLFFEAGALGEIKAARSAPRLGQSPRDWDWDVRYHLGGAGYRFYALRPSAAQHIGVRGLNSRNLLYHDSSTDDRSFDPRLSGLWWRLPAAGRGLVWWYRVVRSRLADRWRRSS